MMRLDDKVALVTRAGSRFGEEEARLFARMTAFGHSQETTEQVVDKITQSGDETMALAADVSRSQETEQATERAIER